MGFHYLAVLLSSILNDIMNVSEYFAKKCECCLIARHEKGDILFG